MIPVAVGTIGASIIAGSFLNATATEIALVTFALFLGVITATGVLMPEWLHTDEEKRRVVWQGLAGLAVLFAFGIVVRLLTR